LVGSDGSIDWCCLPTFSSPSIFAAILDGEKGGRWVIQPTDPFTARQMYLGDTNVLTTTFNVEGGVAELTDFMPVWEGHEVIGSGSEVLRRVRCVDGRTRIRVIFEPRLNYGKVVTDITRLDHGYIAHAGDEAITLSTNIDLKTLGRSARCERTLSAGEEVQFALKYGSSRVEEVQKYRLDEKLDKTVQYWEEWAGRCSYEGPWRDAVVRSALILKLLIYHPTGAIVAAPTTSLPERIGGGRNWDYRYSWLRDSAFSLWAFRLLGYMDEVKAYLRWLQSLCRRCGVELQIVFGINGERSLTERELDHLEGYMKSKPVRVGNAAYSQFQLDIYGTILDVAFFLHRHGEGLPEDLWSLVRDLADFVCRNWRRADHGIWEVRRGPKQFVYSKVWCWVALQRATHIAEELGFAEDAERWRLVRDIIKAEILSKGWSERKRSFVQHFETDDLDAATLLMPLVGFIPATDPRMASTIERITKELSEEGLVYRYRVEDGLEGGEGTFTLCSFWLVSNLASLGRVDEAKALFENLLNHSNHLYLFSEEIDVKSGELLGNFPQAFTHMNLINSAVFLSKALLREGSDSHVKDVLV